MGEENEQRPSHLRNGDVLDFCAYLLRRRSPLRAPIWILRPSPSADDYDPLRGRFAVECIDSDLALKTELLKATPDLFLIDAGLSWADPLEQIDTLSRLLDVPLVLICDRDLPSKKLSSLLKRSYAAGITDVLYRPFDSVEMTETIEVLLKIGQRAKSR